MAERPENGEARRRFAKKQGDPGRPYVGPAFGTAASMPAIAHWY